ncbi:immobilization antigen (macronuclear) [Tetrahymena thermophila SB210]|uniref:Immobilization antigen n=1 Tax=Tetrahymena thermophila (strain SB210) TaxID=312017 RepID=Q232E7_TETTS|nr:immobilization antigen [Tetrahymena thermophila SB210]EAR91465.2 immobilization antigen [Tetrahymena thermophila SB210]|eukprot:XP_001011710.2 immobilization antigen [Tetrahymena thermophila SB210]
MKATSLIFIQLAVIATVNACTDANATAGAGGTCYCNACYYGTSADVAGVGYCQQCPTGTNSPASTTSGTLITSCTCNDTNSTLKSDNSGCVCKANFYGTPNPTAGGATGCTACPTGTASVTGSTAVTSCACNDINAALKADNSACLCKANFYGTPTTFGASRCTACPSGTISVAGSTDKSYCTCPDVNASLNSATPPACQCNANFYGTPTTSDASGCIACPTGTISAAGSTTKYSCTCPDTNASLNFAIPPVCQCNPNFYGIPTTSGASGCTICPLGQTAPAGSVINICKVALVSSTYILSVVSLIQIIQEKKKTKVNEPVRDADDPQIDLNEDNQVDQLKQVNLLNSLKYYFYFL